MSKKNNSAAGLLLNTFGTILLLTMITICTINFVRDGRGYQILKEKAAANESAAAEDKKAVPDENTGTAQKTEASQDSSKNSSASQSGSKPAEDQKATKKPAKEQAGDSKGTGTAAKKPVSPGEEP